MQLFWHIRCSAEMLWRGCMQEHNIRTGLIVEVTQPCQLLITLISLELDHVWVQLVILWNINKQGVISASTWSAFVGLYVASHSLVDVNTLN